MSNTQKSAQRLQKGLIEEYAKKRITKNSNQGLRYPNNSLPETNGKKDIQEIESLLERVKS